MSDILSAEQVAEDRQWFRDALGGDMQAEAVALCDTVDDLREQLRKAHEAIYEERVATPREVENLHEQIRRLTDALREAKPALLRAAILSEDDIDNMRIVDWGSPLANQRRANAAALRALADMGEGR